MSTSFSTSFPSRSSHSVSYPHVSYQRYVLCPLETIQEMQQKIASLTQQMQEIVQDLQLYADSYRQAIQERDFTQARCRQLEQQIQKLWLRESVPLQQHYTNFCKLCTSLEDENQELLYQIEQMQREISIYRTQKKFTPICCPQALAPKGKPLASNPT